MRLNTIVFVLLGYSTLLAADKPATKQATEDPAVARAREQVKMLDDLYKSAVVYITDKYVHAEGDTPAASAAIALFGVMAQKGYHNARLIDVTGDPYAVKNVAVDAFEKKAAEKIKSGEGFVEEIESKDGKRYFRAMTAVPVVSQKCIMCHPHYEDAEKGAAVGALTYQIEIK